MKVCKVILCTFGLPHKKGKALRVRDVQSSTDEEVLDRVISKCRAQLLTSRIFLSNGQIADVVRDEHGEVYSYFTKEA